jgi:hypothetical protein
MVSSLVQYIQYTLDNRKKSILLDAHTIQAKNWNLKFRVIVNMGSIPITLKDIGQKNAEEIAVEIGLTQCSYLRVGQFNVYRLTMRKRHI